MQTYELNKNTKIGVKSVNQSQTDMIKNLPSFDKTRRTSQDPKTIYYGSADRKNYKLGLEK